MRLLVDENLSPQVAEALRQLGYDTQHVREIGLKGRPDAEIMAYAHREVVSDGATYRIRLP